MSAPLSAISSPPPFPFRGVGVCDNCGHPTTANEDPYTDGMYVGSLAPGPTGVLCGACFDEGVLEAREQRA